MNNIVLNPGPGGRVDLEQLLFKLFKFFFNTEISVSFGTDFFYTTSLNEQAG